MKVSFQVTLERKILRFKLTDNSQFHGKSEVVQFHFPQSAMKQHHEKQFQLQYINHLHVQAQPI
jgi:hypothetical protein